MDFLRKKTDLNRNFQIQILGYLSGHLGLKQRWVDELPVVKLIGLIRCKLCGPSSLVRKDKMIVDHEP
mgnify:CR=1 FL=1